MVNTLAPESGTSRCEVNALCPQKPPPRQHARAERLRADGQAAEISSGAKAVTIEPDSDGDSDDDDATTRAGDEGAAPAGCDGPRDRARSSGVSVRRRRALEPRRKLRVQTTRTIRELHHDGARPPSMSPMTRRGDDHRTTRSWSCRAGISNRSAVRWSCMTGRPTPLSRASSARPR